MKQSPGADARYPYITQLGICWEVIRGAYTEASIGVGIVDEVEEPLLRSWGVDTLARYDACVDKSIAPSALSIPFIAEKCRLVGCE